MELNNFYFTFGLNHKLSNYYQLIVAPDEVTAHRKMFELHGKEWAFPYDSEEWDKSIVEGYNKHLQPLEEVKTK